MAPRSIFFRTLCIALFQATLEQVYCTFFFFPDIPLALPTLLRPVSLYHAYTVYHCTMPTHKTLRSLPGLPFTSFVVFPGQIKTHPLPLPGVRSCDRHKHH